MDLIITTSLLCLVYNMWLPVVRAEDSTLRGHLRPIGFHRDSEGHIDILDEMPTPREFWDKYCGIGKPVLLKGAASRMPAISKWTDEYMLENFGDLKVKLESKYERDQKPEGNKGMGQDSMEYFLNTYKFQNKYMVSQLPDPMTGDIVVPQCVLCGTFRDRILEANIWMSSGNTTSVLHGDADNALNCLLNGTKDWILIDPIHEHNIPIVIEAGIPYGGFAALDINEVDLLKYPKFKDVPWYYANVTAGDCLFLPKGHWHQVRSYGSKNMAVSILLARLETFEDYGCPEAGLPPPEKLNEVPLIWTYDGYNYQTMGNLDPFAVNETIAEMCAESNGIITDEPVLNYLLSLVDISEEKYQGSFELDEENWKISENNFKLMQDRTKKVMKLLDPTMSGKVDCSSLSLTVHILKQLADILDPDPGNDENYEFKRISVEEIHHIIYSSIRFDPEKFTTLYKTYGSQVGAEWVLETLDSDGNGKITNVEINENFPLVMKRYEEGMLHDQTQGEFEIPRNGEVHAEHNHSEL